MYILLREMKQHKRAEKQHTAVSYKEIVGNYSIHMHRLAAIFR